MATNDQIYNALLALKTSDKDNKRAAVAAQWERAKGELQALRVLMRRVYPSTGIAGTMNTEPLDAEVFEEKVVAFIADIQENQIIR